MADFWSDWAKTWSSPGIPLDPSIYRCPAPLLPVGKLPESVPLNLEVEPVPEMREASRRLLEAVQRKHLALLDRVEAKLREIEAAGLLDQVDGIDYEDHFDPDSLRAWTTAKIRWKQPGS